MYDEGSESSTSGYFNMHSEAPTAQTASWLLSLAGTIEATGCYTLLEYCISYKRELQVSLKGPQCSKKVHHALHDASKKAVVAAVVIGTHGSCCGSGYHGRSRRKERGRRGSGGWAKKGWKDGRIGRFGRLGGPQQWRQGWFAFILSPINGKLSDVVEMVRHETIHIIEGPHELVNTTLVEMTTSNVMRVKLEVGVATVGRRIDTERSGVVAPIHVRRLPISKVAHGRIDDHFIDNGRLCQIKPLFDRVASTAHGHEYCAAQHGVAWDRPDVSKCEPAEDSIYRKPEIEIWGSEACKCKRSMRVLTAKNCKARVRSDVVEAFTTTSLIEDAKRQRYEYHLPSDDVVIDKGELKNGALAALEYKGLLILLIDVAESRGKIGAFGIVARIVGQVKGIRHRHPERERNQTKRMLAKHGAVQEKDSRFETASVSL
jgi:hypothetical protein